MAVAVVFFGTGTMHTRLALEIVFAAPKMSWKPHRSKGYNFLHRSYTLLEPARKGIVGVEAVFS